MVSQVIKGKTLTANYISHILADISLLCAHFYYLKWATLVEFDIHMDQFTSKEKEADRDAW